MRRPCKTCPFRKTTTVAAIPDGFNVAHFWREFVAEGHEHERPQGVCHYAPADNSKDAEQRCVGWLYDQKVRGVPCIPLRASLMMTSEGSPLAADFMGAGEHPDDVGQIRTTPEVLVAMLNDPDVTGATEARAAIKQAHANHLAREREIQARIKAMQTEAIE